MDILRHYPIILKTLIAKHSVLVLGPRGSGKTFFLSKLIEKFPRRKVINLLKSQEFSRYLLSPGLLFDEISYDLEASSNEPLYVLIDEIQLVPKLLYEVHRAIDDFKGKVVFILTGSSARKLKREDSDLLASRAISINFFPFSSREVDFKKDFLSIMRFGSLPEILSVKEEWLRIEKLNSYIGSYLSEEIKKESEVRNLEGFHRFLELAASINGEPVNYSKIAKAALVTAPTVKQYFSILKDTLIVNEVPAWTHSTKKQLQQASKFYFFDNGVLNALTGELGSLIKPANYRFGRLFENLLINEIMRFKEHERLSAYKLYHYRELRGHEIDLIVQKNPSSPAVAVEIKSSTAPELSDVKTLCEFKKIYPKSKCLVLCRTERAYTKEGIIFENYLRGIEKIFES